jgi:hypothetical protein
MSPLPPVAAAVPGLQRRPPRWQAPQQQAGEVAAAATVGLNPKVTAVTPGDAAAEAAAAVMTTPVDPRMSSSGAPPQPLQSPFAASPEPLARKLDAEFGAAYGEGAPEAVPLPHAAQ